MTEVERAMGYYWDESPEGRILEENLVPVGMQEKTTRGRNLARKMHAFSPEFVGEQQVG